MFAMHFLSFLLKLNNPLLSKAKKIKSVFISQCYIVLYHKVKLVLLAINCDFWQMFANEYKSKVIDK